MVVVVEDGFTGIGFDLYHPRVGWHQEPGTIAATNAADGFAAANALTPLTYTAWQPSSAPASLRITFSAAASPSYLGVAVHTAATEGATITVQKLTGGAWSDWGGGTSIAPDTNDAILFLLNPQQVDGIGIQVTGGTPVVGVMRAGTVMEWPRRATWTGLPITESARYQYDVNTSDTGNWLGRSVKGSGQEFDVQIDHVPEPWRLGPFRSFADYCNKGDAAFFIAPRPIPIPQSIILVDSSGDAVTGGDEIVWIMDDESADKDPSQEVAYAWSPDTVRMSREQPNWRISGSIGLSLQGYLAP